MKQYLIVAFDYADEGALNRRLEVRSLHFETVRRLKESNNFIVGGAILSDDGKMIGSSLIMQFEDEAGLQEWLKNEPYIQNKVWENIEIKPFKVAEI